MLHDTRYQENGDLDRRKAYSSCKLLIQGIQGIYVRSKAFHARFSKLQPNAVNQQTPPNHESDVLMQLRTWICS